MVGRVQDSLRGPAHLLHGPRVHGRGQLRQRLHRGRRRQRPDLWPAGQRHHPGRRLDRQRGGGHVPRRRRPRARRCQRPGGSAEGGGEPGQPGHGRPGLRGRRRRLRRHLRQPGPGRPGGRLLEHVQPGHRRQPARPRRHHLRRLGHAGRPQRRPERRRQPGRVDAAPCTGRRHDRRRQRQHRTHRRHQRRRREPAAGPQPERGELSHLPVRQLRHGEDRRAGGQPAGLRRAAPTSTRRTSP